MTASTRKLNAGAGAESLATSRFLPLLTQIAFVLVIALATARATTLESLRDPTPVTPGSTAAPRGAGPTTSLVLDLLCCMPAMLVLLRRCFDRSYALRFTPAHALLLLFAIFAAVSTLWSTDRFSAAIMGSHLVAAAAMFWAATQLVRSWLRLRVVAALCFGLLLVYTAHGLIHKFIDVPSNIEYWEQHKASELAQRGWKPDSFEARQFEQKLVRGELVGFNASPNTFAAVMVLCGIVSACVAVQRIVNRDEWGWPTAILAALPPAAIVLYLTHSNTAAVTPILATIALLVIGRWHGWLARHRRLAFAGCIIAILIGAAALVGHGVYHGTLPTDSMRFRWRYWSASMRIFEAHPLIGVGWSNFGPHYLGVRLPEAAEEIRDPHNLLVKALAELGVVGAILLIGFLIRGAWELTAPILPGAPDKPQPAYGRWIAFNTLVGIAVLAMLINLGASIDFSQSADFVLLEVLRRVLFAGLLMLGYAVIALRSSRLPILDDRPGPWILHGILVALAIFLLHNTIDFSLFENGPLMVFMTLAGAALGVRSPAPAGQRGRSALVYAATVLCSAAILAAIFGFVVPVAQAESGADSGVAAIRAGRFERAAQDLNAAFELAPVANSDYAFLAAQACMGLPNSAGDARARADLALAIAANPLDPSPRLLRARYLLQRFPAERAQITGDFTRALAIDPNNVAVRLEFAAALDGFGETAAAQEQYRKALELNDRLDAKEPKRLPAGRVEEIRRKLG